MIEQLTYVEKILNRNGFRFTRQRKAILLVIYEAKEHLTPKIIYEKVKDNQIGLATVYRGIDIFNALNIIKKIHIDGITYYEKKIFSKKPLHIHFKCIGCSSIIDIDDNKITYQFIKLYNKLEMNYDIELLDANIMLMGLCGVCREEKRCQDQLKSEE